MNEPNHLSNLLQWLRRRGLAHALAGVAAVAAVCVPLEIAFRTTDYFGLNYPAYVLAGRREGRWMGKLWTPREFRTKVKRNAEGLNCPDLAAGPAEERRVVIAGDSFVEAVQVEQAESFAALADARDPRVRLVPIRVGNHPFSERHEIFLGFHDRLFDGSHGLPRANAVVYVLRERALVLRRSPRLSIQQALFEGTRLRRLTERYSLAGIAVVGYTSSRIREWAEPSGAGAGGGEAALRRETERMIAETLDGVTADAKRLGLDVGVLYIPTWAEVAERRRGGRTGWRAADSLRQLVEERGIPYEDATGDVAERGGAHPYFAHDGHPTADGHRAMEPALTRLLGGMGY